MSYYNDLFPLGPDKTDYRAVGQERASELVDTEKLRNTEALIIKDEALALLAEEAFRDINHYLRPSHLQQLRNILDDDEASANDRFVAFEYLKNASIAAAGVLPMCQDTGTAIIMGKKGKNVFVDGDEEGALARGVMTAYEKNNLRYSQLAPLSMFDEKNTMNNLPAQMDLMSEGQDAYKFLMMAKGGGSANKTFLFQGTPSLLTPAKLVSFLDEKIKTLGTSACPPYHLAIVVGGLSAEQNLKTVKLASARYLDELPTQGSETAHAFRDSDMEQQILERTRDMGIGAQFGGKYFCHDVRVIRLPRHGASLPIGIGVSCGADRQVKCKITSEGLFVERLERDPARFLPDMSEHLNDTEVVNIDLNQSMDQVRATLTQYPVKTRVNLHGTIIVARDLAHGKIRARIEAGEPMPEYFRNYPIYYAGPAKTPEGYASGSFGPTTAGRMDSYVDQFQALGGSMVMLAKGNRSPQVREACKKYGGFYLGSVGGAAANLAEHAIKKMEVVEYPELGMEAVWKIEVKDFPAFIIIDDKGNDFFKELDVG